MDKEGDKSCGKKILEVVHRNLLVLLTVVGVLVGLIVGFAVHSASPSQDAIMWIGNGLIFVQFDKTVLLFVVIFYTNWKSLN